MKDISRSPGSQFDDPVLWAPSLVFLKYAIAFILVGSAAFLFALFAFAPDQTVRAHRVLVLALIAGAAWICLARGWVRITLYLLAIGVWTFVAGSSLYLGGVESPGIIAFPILIMMIGWLIGTRAAIAMAALTLAATLGLVLAESWGYLPPAPPTPPFMRWVTQSVVFVFSAFLVIYVVRFYRDRLEEVRRLSSELTRRTAELQAREADLNRAQSVAHVGSWAYDLATDTMHLSAETCRIFGLPGGTTGSHKAYLARTHPEDRDSVDRAWQAALRGAPFDHVHRIMVGESIRWIRQVAELEYDAAAAPMRAVGITQDITERKQERAALDRVAAIVDASREAILSRTLEGIITSWSKGAEKMLGYTAVEAIGRHVQTMYPPSRQNQFQFNQSFLRDGRAREAYDSDVLAKDGRLIPVSVRVSPMHDAEGRVSEVAAIVVDLSERKHAEDALRLSEANLSAMADNAIVGITVLQNERRVFTNRRAAEMLGYTKEEFLRLTIPEVLHPDSRETVIDRNHRRAAGEDVPSRYEFEALAKDGHAVPLEGNSSMTVWNGQPATIVFTIDIAERKQSEGIRAALEAQLRQSQKMEAIGTLAGGIAHDFNNIIGAILGNAELAREDVGPGDAAQESIAEIAKAGRRARDLVQQILTFSRKQLPSRSPVALGPITQESVRLLRATLPASVQLSLACAPDLPAVMADPAQIEQVLVNLATNAWHAMEGRPGRIDIDLREVAVDASLASKHAGLRPGRFLRLAVRDTGKGMDGAMLERIFEPFFTTKPVGEGTGLGMSVVHGILDGHEGAITVQSAPGIGTTFHLYFPAVDAPPLPGRTPVAQGASAPPRGKQQHVLYLDDDEALVSLVSRLLTRQGYRVSGYAVAREALDAFRADPGGFDLVVSDYNMPGMSGLDVARELARIRPALPVAITSGYITDELRENAPSAGVRHLIYKPDTVEELCDAVRRLANRAA